jgi:hypothetical protein
MRITVKVKPNSSKQEIRLKGNIYNVNLLSPPVEGKANRELIELLSDYFNIPKSEVSIISGHKSRTKIVNIEREDLNA